MKKRILTLAILLGVAGCLVAGIFIAKAITEKQTNTPIVDDKTYCFQVDQEKITKINWTFSVNEELTLEKNEAGEWHLSDEPEQKLNDTKVKTILNSIEEIPVYQEIENADIATYGLDNPTNVVNVTCDGKEYKFTFGPMNAMQTYYYMLFDGRVYLVDTYENTVFDKTRDVFYAEEETTETDETVASDESEEESAAEDSSSVEETGGQYQLSEELLQHSYCMGEIIDLSAFTSGHTMVMTYERGMSGNDYKIELTEDNFDFEAVKNTFAAANGVAALSEG